MAKKSVTRSKALVPEVIDAPPESAELVRLQADGSIIETFVHNMRVFFRTAQQMEMEAKANLVRMETRQSILPKTGDEDFALQEEIRRINTHKKEVESHWEITAIISRAHRTLTGIRARATDADERAAQIGNGLHTRYKDAETARARAEEDRLRREAEDRERLRRQQEQEALEREALKAEAASPELSERERKFVHAFVTGGRSARNAAVYAGYKDPDAQGAKLLNTHKVKTAIESMDSAARLRQQAKAVEEAPVEIEHVAVRPDLAKGGDVTTWSCEVIDVNAFRDAYKSGRYGLPHDAVLENQTVLNTLAKSLHENMDRIPGLRAKKKTSVR